MEVQWVMGRWDKAVVESTVYHDPKFLMTSKGSQ